LNPDGYSQNLKETPNKKKQREANMLHKNPRDKAAHPLRTKRLTRWTGGQSGSPAGLDDKAVHPLD
jgi:hypothetical protein